MSAAQITPCPSCGVESSENYGDRSMCWPCYSGEGASAASPPIGADAVTHADRYAGRILDVAHLLSAPDEPIPWRCENFAADGYLTVLAGKGGEGKSWLALALACGVARGKPAAGIDCTRGKALLFDAENGPKLIGRRLRSAAVTADLDVQPVDVGGLTFRADLPWFRKTIETTGANLVVFDSLRVLASGIRESDGDTMEPLITGLKQMARETGAAIILVHHRGKAIEQDYRGSSVILDQTDLMFRLGRAQGDPEGRTRRQIVTVKCRIDEEPAARWVAIQADRGAGLVTVTAAEPFEGDDAEARPRDRSREQVLDHLGGIPRSGRSIARATGLSEPTVRRVLHDLASDALAAKTPDGWVRHESTPKDGDAPDAPLEFPATAGETGASGGASRPDASVVQLHPVNALTADLFDDEDGGAA